MYSRSFGGSVGVGRRVGHADESWGGHVISSGKLEGNILPVWCFGESGSTVYRSGYLRKARLLCRDRAFPGRSVSVLLLASLTPGTQECVRIPGICEYAFNNKSSVLEFDVPLNLNPSFKQR
jgi:hypothetical protein